MAASAAAHAIVLTAILISVPSELASHAGPEVMPVQLVSPSPLRAVPPVPKPVAPQQAAVVTRPIRALTRHRPKAVRALAARRRQPAAAAHDQRRLANRKLQPAVPVTAAAPPPSAMAEVSARDTDLVRQHLERFKFYPLSARRRGIGGDVEVGFRLTAGGKAEQVRVLASSGYDVLDEAALQTVSRAQPFPVGDGRYRFRLRFRRL